MKRLSALATKRDYGVRTNKRQHLCANLLGMRQNKLDGSSAVNNNSVCTKRCAQRGVLRVNGRLACTIDIVRRRFRSRVLRYLFPPSFLNEPPYLLRLPSMSVISGIKLANMAYNTTTDVVNWYKQTDHTHTHIQWYTHARTQSLLRVYLLPCSFLYEPPYLLRVPRMSIISGMKLANIAWRPRATARTAFELSGS